MVVATRLTTQKLGGDQRSMNGQVDRGVAGEMMKRNGAHHGLFAFGIGIRRIQPADYQFETSVTVHGTETIDPTVDAAGVGQR